MFAYNVESIPVLQRLLQIFTGIPSYWWGEVYGSHVKPINADSHCEQCREQQLLSRYPIVHSVFLYKDADLVTSRLGRSHVRSVDVSTPLLSPPPASTIILAPRSLWVSWILVCRVCVSQDPNNPLIEPLLSLTVRLCCIKGIWGGV